VDAPPRSRGNEVCINSEGRYAATNRDCRDAPNGLDAGAAVAGSSAGCGKPKGRRGHDRRDTAQAAVRMLRALVEQARERRIAAGEENITDEDVVGDVVTVTPAATTAPGMDEGVGHAEELAAVMGELLEAHVLEPDEGSDHAISSTLGGAEAYAIKLGAIDSLRRWESP
jgi:hypothetical protein